MIQANRSSRLAHPRRAARVWRAVALVALVALTGLSGLGCDNTNTKSSHSAESSDQADQDQPRRLVTLAPALTQMVRDLGAGDALVGVAKNDDVAPAEVPIVGTYTDPSTEALLSVEPTHVLMMTAKEGPPDRLKRLAAQGRFELVTYRYPRTLEAVGQTLYHPERGGSDRPPSVGHVLGRADEAAALKGRLFARLEKLKALTQDWPKPRVLLAINTQPLRVTGPGAVNDQLLDYVGARNAVADASISALSLNREALLDRQPEVIVVLDPGGPARQKNDRRLAGFKNLSIPAVREDRLAVLTDPLILLPSTNLAKTAAALAKAIHPSRAEAIDAVMQSAR